MYTTVAAVNGAVAIAMGAFGAHYLKQHITDERLLKAFETGAHYHLIHSVALLALNSEKHAWAQSFWVVGIILFSGSLYLLPWNRKLGIITPFGGLSLIAGWLSLLPKLW
jgi:uncharacterized membrane protein YgdD (TMEM256/DUF423 family)